MGVRQSFARITAVQLAQLQSQPTSDVADAILAEQDERGEFSFSPLEATQPSSDICRLTLEKSYWELLARIVKLPVDGQFLPAWPIDEGGTTIGDFWMGYSPLYILTPDDVQAFEETTRAISRDQLAQRFQIECLQYDDRNNEKERFFEGIMVCFSDLAQLIHQAAAANEAIVWYIS